MHSATTVKMLRSLVSRRGRGLGRGTGRVEFMGHLVDTECVGKDNETK